jgi:hypothetical protein
VSTILERLDSVTDSLSKPWPLIWNGAWKRRHLLGGNLFLIQILVFGLFGIAFPYFASNQFVAANGVTVWDPEIAIDRLIPVIPWMVVPYMALYLYYPVTLICTPKDDRSRMELIAGVQMLSVATLACTLVFLVLPAEVDMRDQIPVEILQGEGLYSALFSHMHAMDEPWNAWPSLHIAHSYFLTRSISRWMRIRSPESIPVRIFISLVWVEFALLSVSILTTKQHYIWDLFTGMVVGIIGWSIAVRALDRIRFTPEDKFHPFVENQVV